MRKTIGKILQRSQGIEQIAPDTRRCERREAPLLVNRQDASGFLQGNSLNPSNDQRRLPVDEPAAVQARKGLQPRKAPMRLVLSIERRPRNTAAIGNVRAVGAIAPHPRRRIIAQTLHGELLAARAHRAHYLPGAPAACRSLIHEQGGETATVGRTIGLGQGAGGFEALNADKPHAGLWNTGRSISTARHGAANSRSIRRRQRAGDCCAATRHGRAPLRSLS